MFVWISPAPPELRSEFGQTKTTAMTTLHRAGHSKAVHAGYEVILVYVGIEPALSAFRIEQCVLLGGHDVPREKLAGRFARSLENLERALRFVTLAKVYDNSSVEAPYRLLATFENGNRTFLAPGIPPWARGVLKRSARKRARPRR